jgi:hypothetical protein
VSPAGFPLRRLDNRKEQEAQKGGNKGNRSVERSSVRRRILLPDHHGAGAQARCLSHAPGKVDDDLVLAVKEQAPGFHLDQVGIVPEAFYLALETELLSLDGFDVGSEGVPVGFQLALGILTVGPTD